MEMQTNMHMDPFEEINMAVENSEQHRRSASEKEVSENSTVDLHHFAFYAFAGQSGTLHRTRKNEDIEADSLDASQLIPQHNYKLDVHALNSRCLGVQVLVEQDKREDTLLKLGRFSPHKKKTLKETPGKTICYPFHKPEENNPPGNDSTKKVSNLIEKAAKYAGSEKSKKVTAYAPVSHGSHEAVWQWQILTGATWSNLPSGMMEAGTVVPTLKALTVVRVHENQDFILAAGDEEAVVIYPSGSMLTSIDLPAPHTHALVTEEFSNDGLTDLILVAFLL